MKTTVAMRGWREIDRNLQAMAAATRGRVLSRALELSTREMEARYRAEAPTWLRDSVRTREIPDASPNRAQVAVGSRHRFAVIFEFGTKLRVTKGKGAKGKYPAGIRRGRITKLGFGRRAFDTTVGRWFDHLGRALWREIRRNVRS